MIETTTLRHLLLPELEIELKKTRRILAALPEGHGEFRPHEKSSVLAKLAGHTAELPAFVSIILTTPDLDLASPNNPRRPFLMETVPQLLAQFDENADKAITALKQTSDDTLHQNWSLSRANSKIFSGSRYDAYRAFGVNHMIHHRSQLGVYIRQLDHQLPGTYGPSADGQ